MIKKALSSALILLLSITTFGVNKNNNKKIFTVVSYNVENLFDTVDDPIKRDEEFTPNGKKKWNMTRYNDKLNKLSKVLSSINKNELPEIIGLIEVENRKVITDLINTKNLKAGKYKIIHAESPDIRGIDCALIYRPDEFTYLSHELFPVNYNNSKYPARDILKVTGKNRKGETLHIFVNHWNSRIGGVVKSEPKRIHAAKILNRQFNKILQQNPKAKIIAMGDFNDEPSNNSLKNSLKAFDNSNINNNAMFYNLMFDLHNKNKGTYSYRSNWNMLDNIIISKSLLESKGLSTNLNSGRIYSPEWICYKNKKGDYVPSRSYGGPRYFGGYSDHFPVYFTLTY